MKKFAAVLGVTGMLAVSAVAQDPGMAPAPGDMSVTTTTTTEVPTTDPAVVGAEVTTTTLPATGGAPIAMALAGALTAGSAFFLRRKLS
jgi:LPXTG-motif cell wall-anchored protein